ncbi:hypothetical protein CFN78_20270 [Amycolatopsis antarctica]|uniref:Uncharacterized protein n=1 Tax=Amycolatopsis antarctica TaxID=1854586 RepID=A0A263CZT6_9PSEU|nr:hypothetical protein [Amycolatopsis antarctica]OZM71479.1 hypothetical protein CFN78_20270 [Amycolatopsis antarctica]
MTSQAEPTRVGAETDTEARLRGLMDRGYSFVHPRDASGEVVAVVGVRAHGSVVDVVRLEAEDDVVAMRIPGGEPDILAPETVLWKESGSMVAVVDKVLALPDDEGPAETSSGKQGCWVPGRPGRAKWLAAS